MLKTACPTAMVLVTLLLQPVLQLVHVLFGEPNCRYIIGELLKCKCSYLEYRRKQEKCGWIEDLLLLYIWMFSLG
jgi:hypothetical protein